jgi:hypothetical protein
MPGIIHLPSRQPYTGRLVNKDPISSRLPLIGQLNPVIEERWSLSQGRAVAGFGAVPESYQGERHDDYVQQIESDDDVVGSGIFDESGRPGTVHKTMGVFSDHPSLPGYIAREVQFAVSKEVIDLPSGADVVVVPGGGMAYVERGGRLVGPLQVDDHNNPYVVIRGDRKPGDGSSLQVPVGPVRDSGPPPHGVTPAYYGGTVAVPDTRAEVPMRSTVDAYSATNPQYTVAFQQSIPAVGDTADASGAKSWTAYFFAAALVGVGAAIFAGTVTGHPTKRRRRAR